MREEFIYPRPEAAKSVLEKIGITPSTRFNELDQDFEYTSCRVEELERYLNLYEQKSTSLLEKRVLGCFFLECLNEYLQSENHPHELQSTIFELLFRDVEIHEIELRYWSDTSEADPENWWTITPEILKWKKAQGIDYFQC